MIKNRMMYVAMAQAERAEDAARGLAAGFPVCIGCGWSSDDRELDLCCDCFDAATFAQMKRGEFGTAERKEARGAELKD